ncbi:hypothetical protein F5888DRAFT_256436 [Russula emetica]|nr:hypothetical protein F5888DRAFT_256436 [Russula emetica]
MRQLSLYRLLAVIVEGNHVGILQLPAINRSTSTGMLHVRNHVAESEARLRSSKSTSHGGTLVHIEDLRNAATVPQAAICPSTTTSPSSTVVRRSKLLYSNQDNPTGKCSCRVNALCQ